MFGVFKKHRLVSKDCDIFFVENGKGTPVVLLHGFPQTHAMWANVAPLLSNYYHVICPDLRGYGQSGKPLGYINYTFRNMANDVIAILKSRNIKKVHIIGHDRGARIGHRLALNYPDKVKKIMLLDIIPTIEHFERTNKEFAMGYYHWFWLAQRYPIPESVINKAPEEWFFAHTSREKKKKDFFAPRALADYLECVKNPETIRSICEDYRAAASIDLKDDDISRKQNLKIKMPTLVLWGKKGKIEQWYDPLTIWQKYCDQEVRGYGVNTGHYLAEENPDEIIKSINNFF